MIGKYFSIFDMAICAVPALAFGVWQLISVEREIAKDKAAKGLAGQGLRADGGDGESSGRS